jgi:hypothetical protein
MRRSRTLKQRNRLRANALLPAFESKPFCGRGLDPDSVRFDSDCPCEILSHLVAEWRDLRELKNQHAVKIDKLEATLTHERGDLGKQPHRIRSGETLIGVREETTDITFTKCAENRIHYRVRKHVCVGVPRESTRVRHSHTRKY